MTVVDPAATTPPRPTPPVPEECAHPAPVTGVMAHEFSPYRGAKGPEGVRRTTMYYGPVVGGLPIRAWHCEECGLLRLTFFDGRKEERRLWPGPQPGLIALPVADEESAEARMGTYGRVSGASLPAEMVADLIPEREPFSASLPRIELPDLGWTVWITSLLVAATLLELLLLMVGAVVDYRTTGWEGPLAAVTAVTFGLAVVVPVGSSAFQHWFPMPPLGPSPVEIHRGAPQLDAPTRALVTLLSVTIAALVVVGLLSVYDWRTPAAEYPLVVGTVAVFTVAVVVAIVGAAVRRSAHRDS